MPGILRRDLLGLGLCHVGDTAKTTVLSQSHWDDVQSVREGFHAVLINGLFLVCSIQHSQIGCHLTGTSTWHHTRVTDEIPDATVGIMQAALGFINHHLVSTTDKHRHSLGFTTLLDHKHLLFGSSKSHLLHDTSLAQFVGRELFESGNDPSTCCDGNELQLNASNPPHGRQFVLKEQVIGLIVKAPLADDHVGTAVLDALDLVPEVLLLVLIEPLVVCARSDVELVLCLWLRRLKRAAEDSHLGIFYNLWHLRMAEVLVHHDAVDQACLLKFATHFAFHLDHVKIGVRSVHVCHRKNSINANLGELVLPPRDHLGSKSCGGSPLQGLLIVCLDIHLLCNFLDPLGSHLASFLKTRGDAERMDALLDEAEGVVQERSSHYYNTCGAVANLIIL
mmetsp:Transcript_85084/g.150453  ORF Transcript_85084/g.150453 Transcript_85084/m.150453 type:complete len:393 (-) Transcript_85084:374-1552(-)